MVIARLSRGHHLSPAESQHQFQQQQQQQQQQPERGAQAAVFKVPTSTTQQEPTPKRKHGEAFSTDETMLSLSCGVKQPRPRGSKLTIFYAGSVNVFDNVPEETARALMTLAASKTLKPAAAAKSSILNGAGAGAGVGSSTISSSSASSNSSSCCLSLADITNSFKPESKNQNSTTEIVFAVLPQPETNVSSNSSKPSSSSSSLPPITAAAETTTTTTTTNPMLPAWVLAGLPQARRNSVQRFLQTRRGKSVV